MSVADIIVLLASAAAVAGLGWFFFAPRKAHTAQVGDGVQRVDVVVRGGYRPDVIREALRRLPENLSGRVIPFLPASAG